MDPLNVRNLVRRRAQQARNLRKLVLTLLYPTAPVNAQQSGNSAGDEALRSLANTFSRFAQTRTTAYESGVAASSNGTSSLMERTVEHAIASVLGRSSGSAGIGDALRDVFPTLADGTVATDPARTIVSNAGIGPPSFETAAAAGLSGQISAEQSALYRQARLIIPDARSVLASITPFATVEQPDVVDSLRGLIDSALRTLLDEFGRVDEPRAALVDDYLSSLAGATGFIAQFGEVAKVDGVSTFPDAFGDEQQMAGFALLTTYVMQIREAWNRYRGSRATAFPLFTERLSRAGSMLGVVAQSNVNFMAAMDAVGFSAAERRSTMARFENLDRRPHAYGRDPGGEATLRDLVNGKLRYSEMTVDDYTNWVEKLASEDGPRLLADAGQYGLEFVTAQADTLFFTIAPVLFVTRRAGIDLNASPVVAQVLRHERVSWALDDLVGQLDALADLAA
jgi:hypothetical protein